MVPFKAIRHKSIKDKHICFYSSMTTCCSQHRQNKAKYSANIIHCTFCPILNVLLSKINMVLFDKLLLRSQKTNQNVLYKI